MEIVLAMIIGLAVAGVVFVFGRILTGSGRVSGEVQDLSELSISASASRNAEGVAAMPEPQERRVFGARPRLRKTRETVPGSDVVQ